ncbi:Di-copper centre-containing protein [Peniophora sp. CONT]|nr:Di-copper centre-containing protein [Peniophora sp. CONT]
MLPAELPERRRRRPVSPLLKALAIAAVGCAASSMLIAANAVAIPCRNQECDPAVSESDSTLVARQNAQHVLTTGAPGGVQYRLEINDLIKDDAQWSLFVQALAAMQADDQSDVVSSYQIAGIHGAPYVRWDGAGPASAPSGSWPGYCNHGNVLFPSWHRPYVALFEQQLQARAVAISRTYTGDRATHFQAAARALRLPFWDWASDIVPPRQVIADAQVTYTAPDGSRKQIANPLYSYRFHPVDKAFDSPFNTYPITVRHPTGSGANVRTDVDALRSRLSSQQTDVRSKTYATLTRLHTWVTFSNRAGTGSGPPSDAPANSIEAIHDGIHNDVGGSGQMSNPSVAAFDPLFFLHHANVDRVIALWEALNTGVWVIPGSSGGGTWSIPPRTQVDTNTDLTPFRTSQSAYWRSSQVTTTERFGYRYADFRGLDMNDPDAVRQAITRRVNQLYGPNRNARRAFDGDEDENTSFNATALLDPNAPALGPDAPSFPDPAAPTEPSNSTNPAVPGNTNSYDYTVRLQAAQNALNGSYDILVFLGPVPTSPEDYRSSPSYVGSHSIWTSAFMSQYGGNSTSQGFVHLDDALERQGLGGAEPEVVSGFLAENLDWRVVKVTGVEVPVEQVPSLKVLAISTPVRLNGDDELPEYGEPDALPNVTAGKPGGETAGAL